jgi:hypothetical protein
VTLDAVTERAGEIGAVFHRIVARDLAYHSDLGQREGVLGSRDRVPDRWDGMGKSTRVADNTGLDGDQLSLTA